MVRFPGITAWLWTWGGNCSRRRELSLPSMRKICALGGRRRWFSWWKGPKRSLTSEDVLLDSLACSYLLQLRCFRRDLYEYQSHISGLTGRSANGLPRAISPLSLMAGRELQDTWMPGFLNMGKEVLMVISFPSGSLWMIDLFGFSLNYLRDPSKSAAT